MSVREEDTLVSLEIFAEERKKTIDRVRTTRGTVNRLHAESLKELASQHRDANKVLVEAIDAAYQQGIPKGKIHQQIGMSAQRVAQLRHALNDDKEATNGRRRED